MKGLGLTAVAYGVDTVDIHGVKWLDELGWIKLRRWGNGVLLALRRICRSEDYTKSREK